MWIEYGNLAAIVLDDDLNKNQFFTIHLIPPVPHDGSITDVRF
jgi:hypothetical protein